MSTPPVLRALDTTVAIEAGRRIERILVDAYAGLRAAEPVSAEYTLGVTRDLRGRWATRVDATTRSAAGTIDDAVHEVRRAINELAVASVVATHTVMNASAVDFGGQVVAFVGPGSSGKSSLVVEATRRGHRFVADDVVALTPEGEVRAYHRPVGIRLAEAAALGVQVPRGPYEFGYPLALPPEAMGDGGALALIVHSQRVSGPLLAERLSPSAALMRLTNQALWSAGHERTMFRRLEALVRRVPAVALEHERAAAGLDAIEQLLRASTG